MTIELAPRDVIMREFARCKYLLKKGLKRIRRTENAEEFIVTQFGVKQGTPRALCIYIVFSRLAVNF